VGDRKSSVGSAIDRGAPGERLLAAHAALHELCHGCREPVAVLSVPQGALLDVNRSFRDLFGVPDPLPPGLTLQGLGCPGLRRALRSWEGTEPRLFRRIVLRGVEGQARLLPIPATFPMQAFLQFTPSREPSGLDEGRLKGLLEDRLQQIGNFERLRALGETAAVIVHEIRVPLSSIHLGVESVRLSRALDPSLCSRLDVALEQLGRVDRLLGSIRDFARPRRPALRPLDVRKTFTAALAAVEASLQGPRTTVTLEVRPDPLWIVADPECLAEVIQNLIVNAVESQPEGGAISLSAAPSRPRRGWVEIRVADRGSGIPPFLIDRVFQPFFTTKRTGTGLGLAIVKNLVELHGGFISLKSVPGRGTAVTLELPPGGPGA
jgi:signal transduction histidine kinase